MSSQGINGGSAAGQIFSPVRTPQIYERVVERVKEHVRTGDLGPGDRLPSERELSRQLGVSRPCVREAIAALQNEGIVQTRPGSGSFIAPGVQELVLAPPVGAVADASPSILLELRLYIEPVVARWAAVRPRRDARAEELLDEIENVASQLSDAGLDDIERRKRWSDADRLFHHQIAVMTGNPLMVDLSSHIMDAMDQPLWQRMRDEAAADVHRARLYAAEHRLIYEAVIAGDLEGSAFYAEHHVLRVRADMSLE